MAEEWWTDHCRSELAAMIQKQNGDLAAARAEIERLTKERDFERSSRLTSEAQLGVEIDRLIRERDEARAQVAAAFEAAAKSLVGRFADLDGDNIRSLTPADAKASIEAYGLEKIREGMRMAADIANSFYQVGQIGADIRAAILDEMEKLK